MEKVHVPIKRNQVTVVDFAEDYFKWAQEDISNKINNFLVSGNGVLNAKSQIDTWKQHRVPTIMNVHSNMASETSPVIKDAATMLTQTHFGEM